MVSMLSALQRATNTMKNTMFRNWYYSLKRITHIHLFSGQQVIKPHILSSNLNPDILAQRSGSTLQSQQRHRRIIRVQ